MNFTHQIKLIIIILIMLLSVACNNDPESPTSEPEVSEASEVNDPYNYIATVGDQDTSISGSEFQVRTDNCGASVSAKETLARSRSFTISLDANVATSLGGEFEGDVLVAGAKVQAAIETSLGIQIGTTETVNAERTLETPADSISIITLQWEEVWDTGNVNIFDSEGNLKGEVPFRVLTTLRLSQKSVEEVPCSTSSITTTPIATQILPTETLVVSSPTPAPKNTPLPTPTLPSTPTQPSSQFSQMFDNVTYTLIEANYSGSDFILTFVAYNEGADKNSCLYFTSSLTDATGVEHRQSSRFGGGASGGLDCLSFDIPHAVPTQFGLVFNSLPSTETNIPFAKVVFRGESELQFRNIPVPYQISISDLYPEVLETESQLLQTLNDVTYRLVEASYSSSELILTFVANNNGADKDICLYFDSFLIDLNGVEHRQSSRFGGGRSGGLDCLYFDIPYAVPTQFGLIFDTLPPTITNLPFVKVDFRSEGEVQFRNIPIPYNE